MPITPHASLERAGTGRGRARRLGKAGAEEGARVRRVGRGSSYVHAAAEFCTVWEGGAALRPRGGPLHGSELPIDRKLSIAVAAAGGHLRVSLIHSMSR